MDGGQRRPGDPEEVFMTELLNLLAAIALLVWGTFIVRTGVLRMFGENLRYVLARGMGSRPSALLAGMGVTMLLQSGTDRKSVV